ncbi:MAG: hypothetical protein EOO89_10540 [Pedobacter sp.]|nr:MAG: hypothetical protein EOO89_10540 [Pedobacter sp.]
MRKLKIELMNNIEIYELGVQRMLSVTENAIEEFSMSGEYSDLSDMFDQGEDVVLSVGDFLNSEDQKVQNMIRVLNCLRDIQDSFRIGY